MAVIAIHSGSLIGKALHLLEVILHIGAHRTGTTSLQSALQKNQYNLRQNGLTYWGPQITRGGIFAGFLRPAETFDQAETKAMVQRSSGAIRMEMDRLARVKQRLLLISEENIMGSMRNNLRHGRLYPALGRRLDRFAQVFGPSCSQIAVMIRPYHHYWASAISYAIPAGHRALGRDDMALIAETGRSWTDVISDIAASFPKANILVGEFDRLVGKPAAQFQFLTQHYRNLRFRPFSEHHNAAPTCTALRQVFLDRGNPVAAQMVRGNGPKYMPFDGAEVRAMTEQYADDLQWLRKGAGRNIRFLEGSDGPKHQKTGYVKRNVG